MSSTDGNRFLEAVRVQDPATCIAKLQSTGLAIIQNCMRFNTDTKFLNKDAAWTFKYLQEPCLLTICGGELLHNILLKIVDPPILWDSFVRAFREDKLEPQAQQAFAWLLLKLVSLPGEKAARYTQLAQEEALQKRLLNSPEVDVRNLGQRIKHILSTMDTQATFDGDGGPGGRHDNDFADFRKITIMPTADELQAEEKPFMRQASAMEDAKDEDRLGIHLDNQFRLLREDMVGEMRDELQIALGIKKGRHHRGLVIDGFKVLAIECDPVRQQPWGLTLECLRDLPQLSKHQTAAQRVKFVTKNKNFMKHNSQTCLIIDDEVVAFPCIHRDEKLLVSIPPILLLQFSSNQNTRKLFLKLKTGINIKLVQISTAVFAYEPILLRLQAIKEVELCEELLSWKQGATVQPPSFVPDACVQKIESDQSQDLRGLLDIKQSMEIKLDASQSASLLAALTQRVSLIQGPPGKLIGA